jgi:hypothetical protein
MRHIKVLLAVIATGLFLCDGSRADDPDDDSTQNDNAQTQEFSDHRRLPQPPVLSNSLRPRGILNAQPSEYRVTTNYDGRGGYVINLLCIQKKYGFAFLKADVRVMAEVAQTLNTGEVISRGQKEAIVTVVCSSEDDSEGNATAAWSFSKVAWAKYDVLRVYWSNQSSPERIFH